MAMSMGGDSPQAVPQRARAPAPAAAAPKQHSDATIQTVKPLAMAAPAPKVIELCIPMRFERGGLIVP